MRRTVFVLLILSLAALPAMAQSAATQKPSPEEAMNALRDDMQHTRADIMAKNLTLTAEQAAKFWPVFEKYQKEQNALIDEQFKILKKYADTYDKLDDAGAMALMNSHLDGNAKMLALRRKGLAEFEKVVPAKLAVRAMQIDERLSLAAQFELASEIPLAH
jgi:Spy/CpxP family protein refolding chaperone